MLFCLWVPLNFQCFGEETYYMVEAHIRYFFICGHEEESLENFLNKLNSFHPTIKSTMFTAEYSKETINFLDVNIRLVGGAHNRFVC